MSGSRQELQCQMTDYTDIGDDVVARWEGQDLVLAIDAGSAPDAVMWMSPEAARRLAAFIQSHFASCPREGKP